MTYFFLSLITVIIPANFTYFFTPFFIKLQKNKQNTVTNYLGEKVATSGGIILLISLLSLQPFYFFYNKGCTFNHFSALFYFAGVTMLGLIDDLWGDKKCKGFNGHFRMLWREKVVSTGVYKAAGGFLLGTITSAIVGGGYFYEWILRGIFLALFSNFFNLLDTRPARAAKVFIIIFLVSIIFFRELFLTLFPLLSALYIYLFWESERKIMLGDAGAYLLGGALGFSLVFLFSLRWLIIFIILLFFIHFYCEKYSLSKILEAKMLMHRQEPEKGG